MARAPAQTEDEKLLHELASFEYDPYGFVMWAFPWGEGELSAPILKDGPDDWQKKELKAIGKELKQWGNLGVIIQRAVASGHGVGKSAFSSWILLWALTTHPRTRGVVTATNDTQLKTKTWAELSTWHSRFIARHLFPLSATSMRCADEKSASFWRIDAIPWNANNPAGFAGLHNLHRRIVLVMDEASGIADIIWETASGALTDTMTQIIWIALGNRTQTSGEFHKCFRDNPNNPWKTVTVDSRTSKFSNKAKLQAWVDEYGEDSDFVRVRVRGLPPRAGISGFFPPELVFGSRKREVLPAAYLPFPVEIGVDPARFGDDLSVITVRQGPIAHGQHRYSGLDGPDLASRVCDIADRYERVANISVDGIGIGASCVDALVRHPRYGSITHSVNVALPAVREDIYFNLRAELNGRLKDWMQHGAIPDDDQLDEEMTSLQFGYDSRTRFQLESKKDLKERIGRSPDRLDSLALTFFSVTMANVGKPKPAIARPVNRKTRAWKS